MKYDPVISKYTIAGVVVPDLENGEEEKSATALGYLSHLVYMIAYFMSNVCILL